MMIAATEVMRPAATVLALANTLAETANASIWFKDAMASTIATTMKSVAHASPDHSPVTTGRASPGRKYAMECRTVGTKRTNTIRSAVSYLFRV